MKTILSLLLLLGLSAAAQTPPLPPVPGAAPTAANSNAVAEAMRRLLPPTAPGAPAAAKPVPMTPNAAAVPAAAPPVAPPVAAPPVAPPVAAPPAVTPTTPPAAAQPAQPVTPAPTAIAPTVAAKPKEEEMIAAHFIRWTAADLTQVLQTYADLVQRTILRPAGLTAPQFVFDNQTPLTKSEFIQALDALLAVNNIAVIPFGEKFMKVVAVGEANTAGAEFSTKDAAQLPELGQYVTHVVQLQHIKIAEAQTALTPFVKIPNAITPIETTGMLILRDYAENVKRMLEMLQRIDVPIPSEIISAVVPIKFAKVADIASALGSLSGGGSQTTVGARPAGSSVGSGPSSSLGRPYTPGSTTSPQGSVGSTTGTPSSTSSFSDRLRSIISKAASTSASGSGEFQIIGPNKIVADERSNSLLIFASRQDMEMITNIVDKLDVVLAQVLIETIILDVSLDNAFKFGVSGIQTRKDFTPDFTGAGGMNANKFFDFSNATATNAAGDLLGSGLRYFGKFGQNYYATLEAAASDGKVNVLQKPQIQTSHATPAFIFIGGTVPYVSSTYYGGGYAGGPSSSYQQLPVGIRIRVTPFINSDGLVFLKIEEFSIDEIAGSTDIQGVGAVPNTTSRQLLGEIAVKDGETIMLGGFIRNAETDSKSGVPFLKDIPLLGNLFKSTGSSKEKKELLVLMRPTVLRTPELASLQVDKEKEKLPGIVEAEKRLGNFAGEDNTAANPKGNFNNTQPVVDKKAAPTSKPAPTQP